MGGQRSQCQRFQNWCRPRLFSYSEYDSLTNQLSQFGIEDALVPVTPNLVDLVWGNEQPKPSKDEVVIHPVKYAGLSAVDKINLLRQTIERSGARVLL